MAVQWHFLVNQFMTVVTDGHFMTRVCLPRALMMKVPAKAGVFMKSVVKARLPTMPVPPPNGIMVLHSQFSQGMDVLAVPNRISGIKVVSTRPCHKDMGSVQKGIAAAAAAGAVIGIGACALAKKHQESGESS